MSNSLVTFLVVALVATIALLGVQRVYEATRPYVVRAASAVAAPFVHHPAAAVAPMAAQETGNESPAVFVSDGAASAPGFDANPDAAEAGSSVPAAWEHEGQGMHAAADF